MPAIDDDTPTPPVMPAFSSRWLFAGMIAVALGFIIVLNASDKRLLYCFILLGVIGVVFFLLQAILFVIAYAFGLIRHMIETSTEKPNSPFAKDNLPPQLIPRKE